MKQTALQDLKFDLIQSIEKSRIELDKISEPFIRDCALTVLEKSLRSVITRIDNELLQTEQEQIYDAFIAGSERGKGLIPFNCEKYYSQTY